jgi:hypothetical protein
VTSADGLTSEEDKTFKKKTPEPKKRDKKEPKKEDDKKDWRRLFKERTSSRIGLQVHIQFSTLDSHLGRREEKMESNQ